MSVSAILAEDIPEESVMLMNFSAGPAMLFPEVETRILNAMEHGVTEEGPPLHSLSHRSSTITAIIDQARASIKRLLNVPESHDVIFVPGGAQTQFKAILLNLYDPNGVEEAPDITYLETGHWSRTAFKAAQSMDRGGGCKLYTRSHNSATPVNTSAIDALFFVTNETVDGTRLTEWPISEAPLIADASSDFLTRPMPVDRFGIIFAGSQKCTGIAGVAIVIVRKDFVRDGHCLLPEPLSYKKQMEARSLVNTQNALVLYSIKETCEHIERMGGIPRMQKQAYTKSTLLYYHLDSSPLFETLVPSAKRSRTNIVFKLPNDTLHQRFREVCHKEGVRGIDGHRAAPYGPHFRISSYTALPIEAILAFIEIMNEFERRA